MSHRWMMIRSRCGPGGAPASHSAAALCHVVVRDALLRKHGGRRRDRIPQAARKAPGAVLAAVREGLVQPEPQRRDVVQSPLVRHTPPQPPAQRPGPCQPFPLHLESAARRLRYAQWGAVEASTSDQASRGCDKDKDDDLRLAFTAAAGPKTLTPGVWGPDCVTRSPTLHAARYIYILVSAYM